MTRVAALQRGVDHHRAALQIDVPARDRPAPADRQRAVAADPQIAVQRAQREVGHDGTRGAARIGEQRRQADNAGFAEGVVAAGVSVREAARLKSFIQALSRTAGNQVDMAEGGVTVVADRARNESTTRIVESEQLTRMQRLLHLRGLIERMTLRPGKRRGEMNATLRGAFGAILAWNKARQRLESDKTPEAALTDVSSSDSDLNRQSDMNGMLA